MWNTNFDDRILERRLLYRHSGLWRILHIHEPENDDIGKTRLVLDEEWYTTPNVGPITQNGIQSCGGWAHRSGVDPFLGSLGLALAAEAERA